jgi:hypothetical protein
MNQCTAAAIAVNILADALSGGEGTAKKIVRCLCVCCYNEIDPKCEWAVHRAPASGECAMCTSEARAREGMLFVVMPRDFDISAKR